MKKVLILAYDFPPYVSVGGLRPKAWFDYFKNVDIEPILVTRQWENKHGNYLDYISEGSSQVDICEQHENGIVIRTPYRPNLSNRLLLKYGESKFRLIRKSITAFFEVFQYLLPVGTKRELYKSARDYISKNKVDCIIATGDPFVLFHYAKKLSGEFNIPWIADYRDPWSHEYENHGSLFEKKWTQYLEKKIVPSAKYVTTVSEFLKLKINELTFHRNIEIIPNGFDSEAMEKVQKIEQQSDVLRIGFAGSIFFWNPIDSFLKSLSDFLLENPDSKIELDLYGVNSENEIKTSIRIKYPNLQDSVFIFPRVPNQELLQKLAQCNTLLLFNHYSILGTKIFDYLGLKRKILLCYTSDNESKKLKSQYFPLAEVKSESNQLQEELINESNSGIAIKDGEHLKKVLIDLTEEFRKTGQISCKSNHIDKYSRKIQTKKLADIIQSIC